MLEPREFIRIVHLLDTESQIPGSQDSRGTVGGGVTRAAHNKPI
jgi:hypothetical protein